MLNFLLTVGTSPCSISFAFSSAFLLWSLYLQHQQITQVVMTISNRTKLITTNAIAILPIWLKQQSTTVKVLHRNNYYVKKRNYLAGNLAIGQRVSRLSLIDWIFQLNVSFFVKIVVRVFDRMLLPVFQLGKFVLRAKKTRLIRHSME